jgi:hypothetical protein
MRTRFGIAAVSFVLVTGGLAQTSRGTVSGTVADGSGAVIAGAQVALVHTQNGVGRSTVSNDAGIYRFDAVDLGRHELKVEHSGFRRFVITEVGVEANRTTSIDVRLELGAVESQVTVSGESEELLVRDAPLRGGNFTPREVRDLPLIELNHCQANQDR